MEKWKVPKSFYTTKLKKVFARLIAARMTLNCRKYFFDKSNLQLERECYSIQLDIIDSSRTKILSNRERILKSLLQLWKISLVLSSNATSNFYNVTYCDNQASVNLLINPKLTLPQQ